MKYEIVPSNQFRKDLRLAQKRGYDIGKIKKVITMLASGELLDANTVTICLREITAVTVNVIFSRTGCLFTKLIMTN